MRKRIIYFTLGSLILGLAAMQVPFSAVLGGSQQTFSLFDFIAPSFGGFLGAGIGAIAAVITKAANVIVHGGEFDTTTIIRLFPLAIGALYFGARRFKPLIALIPLACIALFLSHPEGRGAWYYSLYWLIPVVSLFVKRSVVFNSLGATFTAHAVGGVAFLYAFNLPSEVWIALIPVVFVERMLFTSGIAVSYIILNSLFAALSHRPQLQWLKHLVREEHVLSPTFLQTRL